MSRNNDSRKYIIKPLNVAVVPPVIAPLFIVIVPSVNVPPVIVEDAVIVVALLNAPAVKVAVPSVIASIEFAQLTYLHFIMPQQF